MERKVVAGSMEELRISPDRIEKLEDGRLRDKYLSKHYGIDYLWSSKAQEKPIPREEAEKYAAEFGFLPSAFDWVSLFDYTKRNPALVPGAAILELSMDDWYHADMKLAGVEGSAWVVSPEYGGVDGYGKDVSGYVRPVRFSQ